MSQLKPQEIVRLGDIQMANDLPSGYRLNVQFLVVLVVTFKLPSIFLDQHYLFF